MKAKHTPAPWTAGPFLTPHEDIDPVGVYKVEPAFTQLTELYETLDPDPDMSNYDPDFDEKVHGVNAANARLIAAAPDLLNALVDLLDQLEAVGIYIPDQDSGQWHGTEGLSFTQAEAAIKKAKGE